MTKDSLSSLVSDWGGFEELIGKLNETGDVTVERNALITGVSGATRQLDVVVRHKQGLYEHLVVVECKYLDRPVERLHVDALISTVQEVRASKGVIFSVAGFQSGAVTQARHSGIDLFHVRQPTPEEWGLPGRVIELFLRVVSCSIANMQIPNAYAINVPEAAGIKLDLRFGDATSETPIKIVTHEEKTLEALIEKVAKYGADKVMPAGPVVFPGGGYDGDLLCRLEINIEPPEPMLMPVGEGLVFIPKVSFDLGVKIDQSLMTFDRAKDHLFVLAVEDCVKNKVLSAARKADAETTTIEPLVRVEANDPSDVFQNRSMLIVKTKGLHTFEAFADMERGKMLARPRKAAHAEPSLSDPAPPETPEGSHPPGLQT